MWDTITVDEHLSLFADVNGVSQSDKAKAIEELKWDLKLEKISGMYAGQLAFGKKRKVSYALSVLGDKNVAILDEPTKMMHWDSKHDVWETIHKHAKAERGVLVSTSSILEAYLLCDRIGFMVHGELK